MSKFCAITQYGHWRGEVSADDADFRSIRDVLRDQGVIEDGEFMVGIRAFVGENVASRPLDPVFVRVLLIKAANFEDAQKELRAAEGAVPFGREAKVELHVEEFLRLFKRIDMAISWRGLPVVGRDFEVIRP
jgi:hypothetical protein